jgi:hypothetical protein
MKKLILGSLFALSLMVNVRVGAAEAAIAAIKPLSGLLTEIIKQASKIGGAAFDETKFLTSKFAHWVGKHDYIHEINLSRSFLQVPGRYEFRIWGPAPRAERRFGLIVENNKAFLDPNSIKNDPSIENDVYIEFDGALVLVNGQLWCMKNFEITGYSRTSTGQLDKFEGAKAKSESTWGAGCRKHEWNVDIAIVVGNTAGAAEEKITIKLIGK